MSGMGKWWCSYEKSWDGCMCSKERSRCICRIWLRQWGWRLALATQQWAQNLITWEVISQLIISIFHSTKWKITAPFLKSKNRVLSSKIKECGVWTYQAFMCVCVCAHYFVGLSGCCTKWKLLITKLVREQEWHFPCLVHPCLSCWLEMPLLRCCFLTLFWCLCMQSSPHFSCDSSNHCWSIFRVPAMIFCA